MRKKWSVDTSNNGLPTDNMTEGKEECVSTGRGRMEEKGFQHQVDV